MNIEYSGWAEGRGFFCVKIPVDELKTDYEILYKNGHILRQNGPFQDVTHDWNCDGDVYTQFGAYFTWDDGRGEFLTPVDMVSMVVEDEARIPGIPHPFRTPDLDEKIARANQIKQPAAQELGRRPDPQR